jgi:hypothetical protein
MVDLDQLDSTARALAVELQREFPEWASNLAAIEEGEVAFEIWQPNNKYVFSLQAGKEKISLSYGGWGFVIGGFLGLDDEALAAEAVRLLRGIVTEEQFATVFLEDGQWAGSSLHHSFFPVETKPGLTSVAYSWLGTYDQTIDGPPK